MVELPAVGPCRFRGKIIRSQKCRPCQGTNLAEVFSCPVHGFCTLHNFGITYNGAAGPLVPVCATCDQRDETGAAITPAKVKKPKRKKPRKRLLEAIQNPEAPGLLFDPAERPADYMSGMFRGAGCFLVCGGPSLLKVNLDLLDKRGIVTAAVNHGAAIIRPQLWIMCDSQNRFDYSLWHDPAVMKFTKQKYLYDTLKQFQNGAIQPTRVFPRDLANVWGYKHCHGWNADTFLTQPLPTWGTAKAEEDPDGGTHKSVMLIALRLLYWLGFRRVYILGADFKMKADNPYGFRENVPEGRVSGNNELYAWLNRRFAELRPHFRKYGYEVFNCTEGGKLEAFERLPLASAIERELTNVREIHTEGYYR